MPIVYDIESYPNVFTMVAFQIHPDQPERVATEWVFEVSDRCDQSRHVWHFLDWLAQTGQQMVGFNNLGYDYPVLHHLYLYGEGGFTADDAYQRSMRIINTPRDDRFRNQVSAREIRIPQVDLFKIWHFDNKNRATSLKQIEIALRMPHVADLPVAPGTHLTPDQIPTLLAYNRHDVRATHQFWLESREKLKFRVEMSAEIGKDLTNMSDVSIGSEIFISEMEKLNPGVCGRPGDWRQTQRDRITLKECIIPAARDLRHPEFRRILDFFDTHVVTQTKGVFTNLVADCYGLKFSFGLGGIHGAATLDASKSSSKCGRTWRSTPDRVIQGRDVSSYYPNLSIKNRIAPEHLGDVYCAVYEALYNRRQQYPKSNPRNGALKLALNGGSYGKTNSEHGPFRDPKAMLTVTISGQLLLCMLAERLAQIPSVELIQVNTDGVEYAVDRDRVAECDRACAEWEALTGLVLECEDYRLFAQRDVNNYLCIDTGGKVKCKGAFEYQHGIEGGKPGARDGWHKNQSCKIVAMAAEARMVHGTPVAETIRACRDAYLFMHTLKVQRGDRVVLGGTLDSYEDTASPPDDKGRHPKRALHVGGVEQQRTGRFYAARDGAQLWKIMKPLAKLPHHARPQAILKDVGVVMCNDISEFDWSRLDYDWYITEAEELVRSTGFHA